ncbi:tropomyosin-2-like [Clytia hemisphaerica]|uniref:tropomyosin-2-like n=1 Tax=Clytia hemisphaerica TaxID=252671 RepID=UPI0034D677DF
MFEPTIEENIPMETKNNDDEDYVYENEAYNDEETTTFTDPTRSSTPYTYDDEPTENHPSIENQRRQIKRSKISDLYKHMKWEFDNSAELYLDDKFTIKNEKGRNQLYFIKNSKEYSLTKNNGEFRSQKTINTIINPSEQTILAVSKILDDTPTMIEMQTMTSEQIIETVKTLSRDIATNTDLEMREMLGLDKALTRFKGELVNNASKLTEIDEQIKGTKDELKNAQDPQEKLELKARLKELQQERKVRLEISSQTQKQLSSQIARIRDTLYDFCEDDISLKEKVKKTYSENTV